MTVKFLGRSSCIWFYLKGICIKICPKNIWRHIWMLPYWNNPAIFSVKKLSNIFNFKESMHYCLYFEICKCLKSWGSKNDTYWYYVSAKLLLIHISRSAHRTTNFMNPKYFVCLHFEYFFQIKVLNWYQNTPKNARITLCNTLNWGN